MMSTQGKYSERDSHLKQSINPNIKHEEVEDYRTLYFQTLHKLHQLTSLQSTFHSTNSLLTALQINNATTEHQQNIDQLTQKLATKTKQYQTLDQQLKKLKQMSEEKQVNLRKRIDVEVRRSQLVKEELVVLREEMEIVRKQLESERQMKQKNTNSRTNINEQNIYCEGNKDCMKSKIDEQAISDSISRDRLRQVIEQQHKKLFNQERQIQFMEHKLSHAQNQVKRLNQQAYKLEQLHRIQLQSKQSIISSLHGEIEKKQVKMNHLSFNHLQQQTFKNNNFTQSQLIKQLKQQLTSKDKLIARLTTKIQHYENMLENLEQKEEQLHMELIQKDIRCEQLHDNQNNYMRQIGLLKSALQDIKGSYIHAQLVKQQAVNKCKQQQKSIKLQQKQLKLSRISIKNLSLSRQKLNSSHSTLSSMPFTPVNSLKNSRLNQKTLALQQSPGDFGQYLSVTNNRSSANFNNSSKGYTKTTLVSNNTNRSFYKQNNLKLNQGRSMSRITPFEL